MRIAVVGSGISGLACAWLLGRSHAVVLYEAAPRLGGHSNTLVVRHGNAAVPVDTGFIVYNARNYPNLVRLFAAHDVPTEPSNMSFGFSRDGGAFEYASTRWSALFAQRRQLLNPRHYAFLLDIIRFNRTASAFLASDDDDERLDDWLGARGLGQRLSREYLIPMAAAIWSAPGRAVGGFSARSFLTFFERHGLLTVNDQPRWRTVSGGSRVYVEKLAAAFQGEIRRATPVMHIRRHDRGVDVVDVTGAADRFDAVVLATHADQSLGMLSDAAPDEHAILNQLRYQPNRAVLHSDPLLMPKRRAAWASWNFVRDREDDPDAPVSVTYWMNLLQNIDPELPLFVTLNPIVEPREDLVHARIDYAHPVLDAAAIAAQQDLPSIQGRNGVWYAGAWCGYGFHEDGLRSALQVAEAGFGVRAPWADVAPTHASFINDAAAEAPWR